MNFANFPSLTVPILVELVPSLPLISLLMPGRMNADNSRLGLPHTGGIGNESDLWQAIRLAAWPALLVVDLTVTPTGPGPTSSITILDVPGGNFETGLLEPGFYSVTVTPPPDYLIGNLISANVITISFLCTDDEDRKHARLPSSTRLNVSYLWPSGFTGFPFAAKSRRLWWLKIRDHIKVSPHQSNELLHCFRRAARTMWAGIQRTVSPVPVAGKIGSG